MTLRRLENPDLRTVGGSVIWIALIIAATGNCFETPYGAIPIYLLCGILIGVDRAQSALTRGTRRSLDTMETPSPTGGNPVQWQPAYPAGGVASA